MKPYSNKKLFVLVALVVLVAVAYYGWSRLRHQGPGEGFISGNGRIEATEVDLATKLGGRVEAVLVNEGDFVQAGQVLARMQVDVLEAQRDEALAHRQQALDAVASAQAQVVVRESDALAAQAVVAPRGIEIAGAFGVAAVSYTHLTLPTKRIE